MPTPAPAARRIAITGASGLIGSRLSEVLRGRGDQVVHLVRRAPATDLPAGVTEARWDPAARELDPTALEGVEAVVHLAGAGLGDKRWSVEYKDTIRRSRIDGTSTVAAAVAAVLPEPPRLLSASAVGYYGERGADVLTEDSAMGAGFLAEVCRDWEAATWPAEQAGASVAHLRTGIMLTPAGGALGRLLPFLKLGLAGSLGSGRQYWAWITLHDHLRAVQFLIDHPEITGAVNLTGPHPDTQADVVRALGDRWQRPTVIPAPTIALRLALGEMATEILGSQRAVPTVLQEAGFTWDHEDLSTATAWLREQDV